MFDEFIANFESFSKSLNRGQAKNVNDQGTKQGAIALAKCYFGEVQEHLETTHGDLELIRSLDQQFQYIVELAQTNNSRASYKRLLKAIKKNLVRASVELVAFTSRVYPKEANAIEFQGDENAIIVTLKELVPAAAASYEQALLDISNTQRLSYRGVAADLRESLREVVDHLAPDVAVQAKQGFKLEKDQQKPTMKQKVQFLLSERGRNKTQRDTTAKSIELIEEMVGQLTRAVYNEASLATHVQKSQKDVRRLKRYLDTVYFDLLELG
jgi:Predicted pPIWI-associating nuclease